MAGEQYDALFEAKGRKYNVDPALLRVIAHQESRFNPKAVSPQGAEGLMQIMPATAKGLKINPKNDDEAVDGAARLISEALDRNGNLEDAIGEYHGGPDRRIWGPKNRRYRSEVMAKYQGTAPAQTPAPSNGLSDDALLALASGQPAPKGASAPNPAASTPTLSDDDLLKLASGTAPATARLTAQPKGPAPAAPRSTAADAGLGLMSGVQKGGASLMDTILQASPVAPIAGTLKLAATLASGGGGGRMMSMFAPNTEAAAKNGYKPQTEAGRTAETLGTLLPNAAIPGSGFQRIAGVVLPTAGQEAGRGIAKFAGANEGQQDFAGLLGTVLGGAGSGVSISPKVKLPKADLGALEAEKKRLYAAVDKSGFSFPKPDMQKLAGDLQKAMRDFAGPKGAQSVPAADAVIAHLKELAQQKGGVTLPQLDLFRSRLYSLLIEKGGAEAKMGYDIRSAIDRLMDASGAPGIKAAREANTRWEKVKEITERIKSAELAAGRAHSGENGINAVRQKLSPLVDPLHGAEMKNLSPAERVLVESIVLGDKVSNGLRTTSKLLRNKFVSGPMSAGASVVGGLPAGAGLMGAMEALGHGLRKAGEARTKGQVQQLIDLMGAGGVKPKVPPPKPAPYAGAAAITAPILLATPASAAPPKPKKPAQR